MVVFFGMSLIAVPEAVRAMRRSTRHLVIFCVLISAGLSLAAMAWGAVLLVALPMGLGHALLGSIWRPTYPLILPLTISVVGGCVSAGAGAGLHALGQAHRSMRAMIIMSSLYVICALLGAASGGTVGTMIGAAIAAWIGALLFWRELRVALRLPLRETHGIPNGDERQPSEGENSSALAAVPVCKPRIDYRLKAQSRPAVQLLVSVPRQRRDGPAPSNGLGPASKAERCT
jgi:hypothetical protein